MLDDKNNKELKKAQEIINSFFVKKENNEIGGQDFLDIVTLPFGDYTVSTMKITEHVYETVVLPVIKDSISFFVLKPLYVHKSNNFDLAGKHHKYVVSMLKDIVLSYICGATEERG